jgi:N-acetylmuramoyl-L-alanine amidase
MYSCSVRSLPALFPGSSKDQVVARARSIVGEVWLPSPGGFPSVRLLRPGRPRSLTELSHVALSHACPLAPRRARTARSFQRWAHPLLSVSVLGIVAFGCSVGPTTRSSGGSSSGQALDASAFAPGACVAFGPTKGDRHLTVFLDAGHGGIDPGGVGTTETGKSVEEAHETLPVELDAMALLRAKGFRVVVSRTRQSTVVRLSRALASGGLLTLQGSHDDVVARDICANDAHADALVGIYFDAGSSPQNAGSLTAYDAARPFAAANLRLATLVQHDVRTDMNAQGWDIPNDGVVPDTSLGSFVGDPSSGGLAAEAASYDHLLLIGPAEPGYFSNPSQMPGAVIEPLYLTDPFEGSIATTTHGQMVIASGIARAVETFLTPAKAT